MTPIATVPPVSDSDLARELDLMERWTEAMIFLVESDVPVRLVEGTSTLGEWQIGILAPVAEA